MYTTESWNIIGHADLPVRNYFQPATQSNDKLAVFFPGYAYTLQAPLFFYSTDLLADLGFDILGLDYRYNENEDFLSASEEHKVAWIEEDIRSIYNALRARRSYQTVVFIGKSLGTTLMLSLAEYELPWSVSAFVWLTPANSQPEIAEKLNNTPLPSLVVVGSGDDFYSESEIKRLSSLPHVTAHVVAGADHSLGTAADVEKSIQQLMIVINWIKQFVAKTISK